MELLTLDQKNELDASPRLSEHLQRMRPFYLAIARRARADYPDFHEIDRVDIVALIIKKTDKDVFGFADKGMSVQETCEIFARSVVGHEDEK